MSQQQFEPFGEIVLHSSPKSDVDDGGSRVVRRVGTGVFWALVAVIVTARVFYFDPDFAGAFASLKTFLSSLTALLPYAS